MDSENRNKRDLPEVVADILITLDKVQQIQQHMQGSMAHMQGSMAHMQGSVEHMQSNVAQLNQTVQQMQETQKEQHAEIISSFNHMTNAVLDAMNRQTARYDTVQTTQTGHATEVKELRQRLDNLEKIVYKKAS